MIDGPPTGYIKVSRKVFDAEHGDPFWIEGREFGRWDAWIDLIQLAAWKRVKYRTAGEVVTLDRGEFVASLRFLAKRWSWSIKRVRGFFSILEKTDRVRAQQGHTCGTRYLITKYDAYQDPPKPEGTGTGIGRAQQGHKKEEGKEVKKKPTAADASVRNLDALPKADCDAAYERWVSRFGGMDYPRFRKALLTFFKAKPRHYSGEQLAAAVDAFYDGYGADDPKWRGKWTVGKFAAELHTWVRLGGMELVDEWGLPTERGRVSGVFAA